MTAITNAGSGNWDSTTPNAPWPGGTVPVSGDTVTLANGFTVTVPFGYQAIVGTSPADDTGTPAIQCASAAGTGVLVVNGTLTYRGPIRQATGTWTVGPAGILEHDSSLAGVPSTANYTWLIGQTSGTATKLVFNGSLGNRCLCRIAASSGVSGGFPGGVSGTKCGQIVATYTTFSDWGTAAGKFANPRLFSSGDSFTLDNCLMDRCGKISIYDCRNTCNFRIKNTSIRSPANTAKMSIECDTSGNGLSVSPSSGDRRLENAYIDGQIFLFNASLNSLTCGLVWSNVIVTGGVAANQYPLQLSASAGNAVAMGTWENVLLYNQVVGTGNPSQSPSGTMTRSILLRKGGSNNPHFIDTIRAPTTWDGVVAESLDSSSVGGDLFQTLTRTTSHFAVVIKNVLALPDTLGKQFGAITNHSDGTAINGTTVFGPQFTLEHNTWSGDDGGSNCVGGAGENNTSFAGMYASVRANLVWLAASATGWVVKWHNSTTPVANSYTACDHNGTNNLTGVIYHRSITNPTIYATAPGTGDISAAPQFLDTTRKFLAWAASVDPTATTSALAMNRFSLMNDDSGSIPGFTVAAAYDWIRAGWVPQNLAYNVSYAGDANQYIGIAAAPLVGGLTGPVLIRRRRR